ncbi:MAG TPA: malto-oligosyltrehalose synthase [Aliidongia sp.]|uniref:malto-oligosyltrehalose synthase n=1 Tax=Aliidongia sp. TaxID=1914230 RepID=UPI002DDDAF89|nr:malto-oligosyltrehalose synthase [Aliidongia sp.]HEV2675620.1 malto-oligosyltrehalose synthase [Aliidongia sp.]
MVDPAWAPPRATYRLQLTRDFTFRDARAIVPLIAQLGVSHAYLSPILTARPGSTHGYDVTDHDEINPELGGEAGFLDLAETLHRHGLAILLDIVPNHMGVGPGNGRWMDLLRWGRHSTSADFFDIDWHPPQPDLVDKVMLPFLGGAPDALVAKGEIELAFDGAQFLVRYHDHAWPVTPTSVGPILEYAANGAPELVHLARDFAALDALTGASAALRQRAERLEAELALRKDAHAAVQAAVAAWNGSGRHRLTALLERQCWRLADWRRAAGEINYRRFFAINDLVAVRAERPEVFDASHGLILRLVADGLVDGLRIDHIDGLADPKAYLDRLASAVRSRGRHPYILVEKILGADETLPAAWPVAGSTGYDRLGPIDRLFCDPDGADTIIQDYCRLTGRPADPAGMVLAAKRRFLETEFASEMSRLAHATRAVADEGCRALPLDAFERALIEVIARLPVYRTYADAEGIDPVERSRIVAAIEAAAVEPPVLATFLTALLTSDVEAEPAQAAVVRLFQQLSGPAMAKGLEDTVFFQHVPLLGLNEVGGEPGGMSLDPASFHKFNEAKLQAHPNELIAGSTHDTKRGEDARTRLLALTSVSALWRERQETWRRLGPTAPSPNDAAYLAQTLVGAWPPGLAADDEDGLAAFAARVGPAMLKAVREAKERTNWSEPDEVYEQALEAYVAASLDPDRSGPFLAELAGFCETTGFWGALTSLSATLLRLTTPGVPDIYQGADGWNLSMVDPDNRRPVDYRAAATRLGTARTGLDRLRGNWHDGAVKSDLVRRTLELRRTHPALFAEGSYRPLDVQGATASLLVAFAREGQGRILVLAPRFWPRLWPGDATGPAWGDMKVTVPAGTYRNVFTDGRIIVADAEPTAVTTLLGNFPVGLLVTDTPVS